MSRLGRGWLGRRPFAALLVMLSTAAIGGCGGTPSEPEPRPSSASGEVTLGADGVQSITLVSDDDYRFVPAEFSVTPGHVRVTLDNTATQLTHSLEFPGGVSPEDIGESIPVVAPTEVETIEFSVSTPGEYAFICSFHVPQGHAGVMTVAE